MKGTIWITLTALALAAGLGIQQMRVSMLYARLNEMQQELAHTAGNVDRLAASEQSLADSLFTTIHALDIQTEAINSHSRAIINLSRIR